MKNIGLILLASFVMLSCNSTKNITNTSNNTTQKIKCEGGKEVVLTELNLDGCSWVFTIPDNVRLLPINLEEYIAKPTNNKRYRINYRTEEVMTTCMAGTPVYIECLEEI
jgi:hypothetical protein